MSARRGLLAEADGGTLFLDEVAEIPSSVQAKLLRFLQFGEVRRIGSDRTLHIKARIIAATNRDLDREVAAHRFRQDLYYRLDVFRITLPRLRDRLEDLPELSEKLLRRLAADLHRAPPLIDRGVLEHLGRYAWPGNVRELENALERAMLTASDSVLRIAHFPLRELEGFPSKPEAEPIEPLEAVERRHILSVLEQVAGDRQRASELLGIARSTLRRKLIEYGISSA